jgi:type I restriction enzyme S subunit
VAAIRAKSDNDTQYLSYQVVAGVSEILASATGATFPSVDGATFRKIIVALPSPNEQRAIAKALSDVDALVGALEKLIAKKRAIKQAAMQQLLTGKTRLPGFSGEWETKSVQEIAGSPECIVDGPFGSNLKKSDYIDKGVPVLQGMNITADRFSWRGIRYISSQKAKQLLRSNAREGDILTVKIGSVGFSALIDSLNSHEYAIIPANLLRIRVRNTDTDAAFFAHLLSSNIGKRKLMDLAGNTAQPALGLGGVRKLLFAVPPTLTEQTAIAAILSDIDAEIAALERRRDKTKQIKQGMMQELLTGRTRLV